jgi:hypothetical protein
MADEPPLAVGDHVQRIGDGFPQARLPRKGVVTEVYQGRVDVNGHALTFYAVEWDQEGFVERGYLRSGLQKVE